MKSILDPTFRYTTSANTDLRKTFARVRRELLREAQANQRNHPDSDNVAPLYPRRSAAMS
ncbi:MAG: hypothetical protein ABI920_18300 [Casimicrobiaceae bacterium]